MIFSGREEVLIVSDSTEKIIVVQVGGTALATANRVGKKGAFLLTLTVSKSELWATEVSELPSWEGPSAE